MFCCCGSNGPVLVKRELAAAWRVGTAFHLTDWVFNFVRKLKELNVYIRDDCKCRFSSLCL